MAMECPDPRVALGEGLRGLASAAIDVSDGLLGDLGHILQRSRVGADLFAGALPCSPWLLPRSRAEQLDCILAGGDDYELLFTAPPAHRAAIGVLGASLGLPLTRIGRTRAEPGRTIWPSGLDAAADGAPTDAGRGQPLPDRWASFDHFKAGA